MHIQTLGKNMFSKTEITLITMIFKLFKTQLARLAPYC